MQMAVTEKDVRYVISTSVNSKKEGCDEFKRKRKITVRLSGLLYSLGKFLALGGGSHAEG